MSYVLESSEEVHRLERQGKLSVYRSEHDFQELDFTNVKSILDVGCGSGEMSRYLKSINPQISVSGCDVSPERVAFCLEQTSEVGYFVLDILGEIDSFSIGMFDLITNRFVAHHLTTSQLKLALQNFKKLLAPNGRIFIIDADGIAINLGSTNSELIDMLEEIKKSFPGNLQQARLLPKLLEEVGFQDIQYDIRVMDFQNEARDSELVQWNERISQSMSMYQEILGSEIRANRFKKLFLEEIENRNVPFFYNKFLVEGRI